MSEATGSGEVFDLTDFNTGTDGFTDTKPVTKFQPVVDGIVQSGPCRAQVNNMWLKKNDEGKLSLNASVILLDGMQKGSLAYKKWNLEKGNATSMRYLKTDLMTLGITTDDLNDLNDEAVRAKAKGVVFDGSIKITQDGERHYTDIRINRRVQETV